MIIYGSKTKLLTTELVDGRCPNCNEQNCIQMSVFQKYAHVFWIPLFPMGKTGATQCSNCKQVLSKKEFSIELKERYETLKTHFRTPVWTFSGLAILAILITWGVYSEKQNKEKNAQVILSPMKGDIYHVKTETKQYTLYKVDDVVGDTIYLLMSEYETNKISGLMEMKRKGDAAYGQFVAHVPKSELKQMFDKEEIFDIERE